MTDLPILGPLFSLLICLAKYVVGGVIWAIVSALNGLIAALGAAVGALLSLLPQMDLPVVSPGSSLAFLNRFAPLSEMVAATLFGIAFLLAWHVGVPLLRKFGVVS